MNMTHSSKNYFENIEIFDYNRDHFSIKDSILYQVVFSKNVLLNYLKKHKKLTILDSGCGICDLEILLKKKKLIDKTSKIIAIDQSLNMLKECNEIKNNYYIEPIIADALFCPIAENCIDIIFAINITPYIDNIKQFISESQRILKKRGLFVLIFPKKSIYWNDKFENIELKFHEEMLDLIKVYNFNLIGNETIKFNPITEINSIEIEIANLAIIERL